MEKVVYLPERLAGEMRSGCSKAKRANPYPDHDPDPTLTLTLTLALTLELATESQSGCMRRAVPAPRRGDQCYGRRRCHCRGRSRVGIASVRARGGYKHARGWAQAPATRASWRVRQSAVSGLPECSLRISACAVRRADSRWPHHVPAPALRACRTSHACTGSTTLARVKSQAQGR